MRSKLLLGLCKSRGVDRVTEHKSYENDNTLINGVLLYKRTYLTVKTERAAAYYLDNYNRSTIARMNTVQYEEIIRGSE